MGATFPILERLVSLMGCTDRATLKTYIVTDQQRAIAPGVVRWPRIVTESESKYPFWLWKRHRGVSRYAYLILGPRHRFEPITLIPEDKRTGRQASQLISSIDVQNRIEVRRAN